MKISVTLNDIHAGVRFDCDKCAVAIAIERELGVPVSVESEGEHIVCGAKSYVVAEDDRASVVEFIQRFDIGNVVSPIDFELREVIDAESPTKDELLEYYGFEDSTK